MSEPFTARSYPCLGALPRFREVMARNPGVNDPLRRAVKRPRALVKGRSRHGSRCPLSCHGRGPEVGRFVHSRLA